MSLYPMRASHRTPGKTTRNKELDMPCSARKEALHATGVVLTASVATFAAAVAITMSGPAFAAAPDYRFEVEQVAPAGPGKSDVTVRLVRAEDGTLVTGAALSANAAGDTEAERTGYRLFRVNTAAAGPQTLQVFAKVPGPTRIERTFNSSIKATLERTVRGEDKAVSGTVVFNAQ
ncbi:MAG: hypothetical protein J0J01_14205 [Reyranella sp.]|uniref:hypothetical protein n=1 Tax=Reyranella sp. TaxID=1929291 RepID=UPI001AC3C6B4|nr:hypothetical protein [Reyranella sp.]MBN9088058.1 hypothetical protein [Reyranella sp.]